VQRRRHGGVIETTAIYYRYGTHLPAALRLAPADVNRYVGQGDQTLLVQNLGASPAITRPVEKRLSPRTRPT
jgi:hypothetical protein